MWLYIPTAPDDPTPFLTSPSAPAAVASISASNWRSEALAPSVTWRGRPSPAPIWSRRCARASWLQRLCGAMPEPSTAALGAALWMDSLAASRASRTASPDASAEASTSAISGASSGASPRSAGPGLCSSKTSPACSRRGLTRSLARSGCAESYRVWVMRLRADYSARRKLARRIAASGCSCLAWPAAMVADAGEKVTPQSHQSGLIGAVANWPTPTNRDCRSIDASETTHGRNARPLSEAVGRWATPSAGDGFRGGAITSGMTGTSLTQHVNSIWSTPSISDVTGGRKTRSAERAGERLMNGQAGDLAATLQASPSSPLAPKTLTDGAPSSRARRSLNPLFVEWLMGWPREWTALALSEPIPSRPASTGCASSATALSPWRRRLLSALSLLPMPRAPMPAQADLFGVG
jgi:hypothetical protein